MKAPFAKIGPECLGPIFVILGLIAFPFKKYHIKPVKNQLFMHLTDPMTNYPSDFKHHQTWKEIQEGEGLETLLRNSEVKPQLIYKHSHRCSVCFLAKQEVEDISNKIRDISDMYLVNVIHQRNLSDMIASKLDIRHESPQVIILEDREILWKGSHWEVKGKEILKKLV